MSDTLLKVLVDKYDERMSVLFTLGRNGLMNRSRQLDYVGKYGFSIEDKEQLLLLACDMEIFYYDYSDIPEDEGLEFFSVIHAWHVLSQLKIPEAKQIFLDLFESFDNDYDDNLNEWMISEFRTIISPYRHDMFEYMQSCIMEEKFDSWVRVEYIDVIKDMYEAKEISFEQLNMLIDNILSSSNDAIVNAATISVCMDHMLVKHHDAIKKCFERRAVDIDHIGDLEDVEIRMALREKRETKRELTELQKSLQPFHEAIDELMALEESQKQVPSVRNGKKIGRNEPCPCGSNKKYKKCCGK